MVVRTFVLAFAIGLVLISTARGTTGVAMNRLVRDRIDPQLTYFFGRLSAEKERFTLDGEKPFESGDKFLPGKIAVALSDALLNAAHDPDRLDSLLRDYRAIADTTVGMDNQTWGIYYYLSALYALKKAGLLERAVNPAVLSRLKQTLDWRTFVTQSNFEIIGLPTNYYGVAFGIAQLRARLGWEDDSAGKILLNKLLEHYRKYSDGFGFSDETAGEGRFDRYSILLIAEICRHFVETGTTVTPELKRMLRRSADIALATAEPSGAGFSFGRSIGAYGDTAELEILSIAAYLDVLTPAEKQYAYAYCTRVITRYLDFWFDPATQSVDLWGKGRRTDSYRGKDRNLGENLSLLHQIVSSSALWEKQGFGELTPKPDLDAWSSGKSPKFSLFWFARGEYDRALATFRDQRHVFSVPLINGGTSQHANSPYYPLPFSNGLIAGVADSGYTHPQLLSQFKLADGSVLMGTAYFKDVRESREGQRFRLRYAQSELDLLGDKAPRKDKRIRLETDYTFEHGAITRTDRYTAMQPLSIDKVAVEFASFSTEPKQDGNKIHFATGDVTDFQVYGFDACSISKTLDAVAYRSPTGPLQTVVSCVSEHFVLKQNEPLTIRWTLRYR